MSPSSSLTMPATPIADLDKKLERLKSHAGAWVALSANDRAALLRACMKSTAVEADAWADKARQVKGYATDSNGHGEEYLGGTLAVMRNLRLFAEALEAGGEPKLPKSWQRPDGQWIAQVFPQGALDKALFAGTTVDIWIEPGKEPTRCATYRNKRQWDGGVSVVLGAGNQSSIPPMDVLYKLVVDDEVCILKMNPVNEAIGPHIERALQPLVDAGFLEMAYGGIEQGKHLTDHETVRSIHITGSDRAHDAIIWGPGEEGAANKAAGTPRLDKHITSELGCVSPVLIVPGQWSDADLDFQARQVASMLAYNCGFNCNGSRLIVLASGWSQGAKFKQLVYDKLAATPTRKAYYPNAQATWDRFTSEYKHTALGSADGDGVLPWTLLEGVGTESGEFALANEPWAGIMSFIEIEADDAASYLKQVGAFANDKCWGTLSINLLIHPKTEKAHSAAFDQLIAGLRYGTIAINCWSGLGYGIVNATWGAFPGHPLDDIESGQGVVHNGLLIDHPQKSVIRTPFRMNPTPAWFTDHKNNVALGRVMTQFESAPGWLKIPKVALTALKG
ncbi:MAG: aldehyde dehydrogenase [Myxococcales bacterium]|nr:aldehyde dehydrogenase [Myxococcales bacterium]